VALFFHWTPDAFHVMHEWLSVVLLVPFALHVWRNWPALIRYVRHKTLFLPVLVSILVVVPFAASGLMHAGNGGPLSARAARLLLQTQLTDLAPVLKTTPDALRTKLVGRDTR
jgi:hypothetical protein